MNCERRVVDLVPAAQSRPDWFVTIRAGFECHTEPAIRARVFDCVRIIDEDRIYPNLYTTLEQNIQSFRCLFTDDCTHTFANNRSLFSGDKLETVTQVLLVVHSYGRDHDDI